MKKGFFSGVAVCLSVVVVCTIIAMASPGSSDDPVVSLSYLEGTFLDNVRSYIDQSSQFTVVEMKEGETLIGKAGCELILRMGQAGAITTDKGGLADTTSGGDLPNNAAVPPNHLLIVPTDDGRGVKALSDVILLVKGGYDIK